MVVLEKGISTAMNCKIIGTRGRETLVLAHGYGGDQSVWDKIIGPLSANHQVLVFDWCFSGLVKDLSLFNPVKHSSYDAFADDLIALLDEMKLDSAIFVGHSMSGMIGCIASIKRPHLFKRLILLGASPRYLNSDGYEGGFEEADVENIILNIESNYSNWTTNFASLAVGADDPTSVELIAKCFKRMRQEVALPLAKVVFGCDERRILEDITTPCTIIQTANDVVVPKAVAVYMEEKMRGKIFCSVEMINAEGHFPQLTTPAELIRVLRAVFDL